MCHLEREYSVRDLIFQEYALEFRVYQKGTGRVLMTVDERNEFRRAVERLHEVLHAPEPAEKDLRGRPVKRAKRAAQPPNA